MLHYILQKDKEILIFINNLGSKQWDTFWLFITNQFNWIPLFAFILFLVLKKFSWKEGLLIIFIIALMVTFSDQFTNFIRVIFKRLRPCNDLTVNHLIRVIYHPTSYSFTSGHATTSTSFSIFIILIFKNIKYIKWILLFPIIFSYSRIYLGVHFPLDIICGAIIGLGIGFVFYKLYNLCINNKALIY